MKRTLLISLVVLAMTVACGGGEPDEAAEAVSTDDSGVTDEREIRRQAETETDSERDESDSSDLSPQEDPSEAIPRMAGEATEEGYGLTMIVDGSSPEAFAESLSMISEDTTQEQYRALDSALRFLKAYDSAAWSGLPNLYQTLDGMTGEEIIERARKLREERQGR